MTSSIMTPSKLKSMLNVSLNDSDDSAFQSSAQKRKLKPASPKPKRRKVTIVRTDNLFKTRTRSAPELVVDTTMKPPEAEEEIPRQEKDVIKAPVEKKKGRPTKANQVKISAFLKNDPANKTDALACPLCNKQFENTFTHLSHMKQCAKKKKISTAELLRTIELKGKVNEGGSAEAPFTYSMPGMELQLKDSKDAQCDPQDLNGLALASALSLSISKPSDAKTSKGPSAMDKHVYDSQKATLDKYGFTTSTPAAPTAVRRGRGQKSKPSVLKLRTAEERLQILSEKASVILLSNEEEPSLDGRESSSYTQQIPKLWRKAESELDVSWYLENLKPHISHHQCIEENTQGTSASENVNATLSDSMISESVKDEKTHFPFNDTKAGRQEEPATSSSEFIASSERSNISSKFNHNTKSEKQDEPATSSSEKSNISSKFSHDTKSRVSEEPATSSSECIASSERSNIMESLHLTEDCPDKALDDFPEELSVDVRNDTLCQDWGRLIGCSQWSDACLVAENGSSIPIHTLVFHVRCPAFELELLKESALRVSPSSLLSVLHFVYSGKLTSIASSDLDDCILLANTLGCYDLVSCLQAALPCRRSGNVNTVLKSPSPGIFDEADTVPNEDVVDLTRSVSVSPEISSDILRVENETLEEREQRLELLEQSQELEKINSFIEQRSMEVCDDEDEQDNREREKIYSLSMPSSQDNEEEDLFEEYTPVAPIGKSTELIVVSSDTEQSNHFEASTDDDVAVTAEVRYTPPAYENFDPPFFDSPGSIAAIDYDATPKQHCDFVSQSLMEMSPGTPRKAPRMECPRKSDGAPTKTERRSWEISPEGCMRTDDALAGGDCIGQSASTSVVSTPKIGCLSGKRRRSSAGMRLGSKIVRRSVKALARRRSRSSRTPGTSLSNSLVAALDESWNPPNTAAEQPEGTPSPAKKPFVEITPRATPSLKFTHKVTPRPDYSGMKTDSLKKNLQKFGLKRSLGKVKARKILRHIYDEHHPVINSVTGKFVKFLPEEAKKATKKRAPPKAKASAVGKKGTKAVAKSKAAVDTQISSDDPNADPLNGEVNGSDSELVSLCSSDSELSNDEFNGIDDEILTQAPSAALSLDEAFKQYLQNNPEFHTKILTYEPVWVETLRKDIQQSSKSKFKVADVMDFLDKKCISFRSELQNANNQRRNERKKVRQQKKKMSKQPSLS